MSRNFKKCLITGSTGSGGSYLVEHILKKDKKIKIFGLYRSSGYLNFLKKKYKKKISFYKVDLKNFSLLKKLIIYIKPDLVFHMASNANVRESFDSPVECTNNNNLITVNLLEAVRQLKLNPLIIICSTSEVYGAVKKKRYTHKGRAKYSSCQSIRCFKSFSRFNISSVLQIVSFKNNYYQNVFLYKFKTIKSLSNSLC